MHKSIEWAAGLFEGEGCIDSRGYIKLEMTDKDVVEDFQRIVGCGVIYEPKLRDGRKQSYYFQVGNKKDVRSILSSMLPYLGTRRAHRALDALDYIELS